MSAFAFVCFLIACLLFMDLVSRGPLDKEEEENNDDYRP
jgi:hypothetical protein